MYPERAEGDAAFVALACDHIVVGPDATFGGEGVCLRSPNRTATTVVETLTDLVSRVRTAPRRCPPAMVDPDLEVFAFERAGDGLTEYFSEDEVGRSTRSVTPGSAVASRSHAPGEQLTAAHGGRGADSTVWRVTWPRTLAELKNNLRIGKRSGAGRARLGRHADRRAEHAAGDDGTCWCSVSRHSTSSFNSPDSDWAGLSAVLCFLLYFWGNFLGGTAGWLELVLFGAGVITFVAIEVFVLPGLGAFGVIGGLCMIVSLILMSQTFIIPHNQYELVPVGSFAADRRGRRLWGHWRYAAG